MRDHPSAIRKTDREKRLGFSLLEVTISVAVLSAVLLATAGAFSSTMKATDQARRTTSAAIFLDATLENVSAQPYSNLLALNGNRVFDVTNANDSNHSVDLAVFQVDTTMIQVNATLNDLRTGRVLGRLSSLRSSR